MLNQEMQFYEQAKKQLLQQKKERKYRGNSAISTSQTSCFCTPEGPKLFESERKIKKERKQSRLSDFQKTCKKDGMSCFTVDDKYWTVSAFLTVLTKTTLFFTKIIISSRSNQLGKAILSVIAQ